VCPFDWACTGAANNRPQTVMTTAATKDDVGQAGRGWDMLSKIAGWEQAQIIGRTT